MVINPQAAEIFIQGYSSLLTEVHCLANGILDLELVAMLHAAREIIVSSPSIIVSAASELKRKGRPVPPEVVNAINSLQLKQWVYLRDTKAYSIFLEPSFQEAYAVLGLTDRIRDIHGGSGISFRTGIVEFRGRFVCDGLFSNVVWLGSTYRKEFSSRLATLKKDGKFHSLPTR